MLAPLLTRGVGQLLAGYVPGSDSSPDVLDGHQLSTKSGGQYLPDKFARHEKVVEVEMEEEGVREREGQSVRKVKKQNQNKETKGG